ncbi:hypothetical protein BDV38DRAFT_279136 [Aspergillus pseudotamarii]|uniref:Uncharacterized protein n=1 Tax=Aspergillus pseudotamarii TaxID=132259 RepID=A0A5N6T4L8_ASPPS|nr:uncharacterized protein BDV38DRAFT_279136 [Aspergillus pseudotamarii]KAE8141230.1 hypothetical protein BDV38DRAFT_279136 [Aspergillus pseudotamarii]
MSQHFASSHYVSHKVGGLRLLYEPLSLLCALREQIPEHKFSAVDDACGVSGILQRRRKFLNALVRLAALKQEWHLALTAGCDEESVIIVVAGNLDVSDLVVPFLEELLGMVNRALDAGLNARSWETELGKISNYVMDWQGDNSWAVYHRIFDHIAPVCIPLMAASPEELEGNSPGRSCDFPVWFKQSFVDSHGMALRKADMPALVQKCYAASRDGKFDIFKRFICQSQPSVETFEEFHQQLLDLAMPMKMCDLLLRSAICIREHLQRETQVEHVPPVQRMKIPLVRKKQIPDAILNRIDSDPEHYKLLRQGLEQVVPAPSKLSERLKYYPENVYTEIHPELRVIDFFDKRSRLQYWDDCDKYIATSKPCCYLCSQYVSHRRNHQIQNCDPTDIDLQWRLPDIRAVESNARFDEQKMILRKMTERARRDVENFILERCSGSNDLSDDDSSQSSSLSIDTITTLQELSIGEANEYLNPYRLPPVIEGDKCPGSKRCDGSDDEDDEETVVFKGRRGTTSTG